MRLTSLFIVVLVAALVALPVALRPEGRETSSDAERLVVITPHNEQIRHELGRGFSRWMRETLGRDAAIEWRTPGGTSDIRKLLESQYAAAIERGIIKPGVAPPAGTMPYDIIIGGGTYEHSRLARGVEATVAGERVRVPLSAPADIDTRTLEEVFGENRIGPSRLYDPGLRWIGTTLSSFGILYNVERLAERGVAPPESWEDLTDPRLAGWLALADPRQSGSVATTYESILDAHGWDDGWRILRAMSANARYFSSSATLPVLDISSGEAAAGLCIDFYGRFQAQVLSSAAKGSAGSDRLGYVEPAGQTRIDPDPVSILAGGPNPELALRFVEFIISEFGQAIWQFPAVGPDAPPGALGPEKHELRRLPIRRSMYKSDMFARFIDRVDPYAVASDAPPRGWRGLIGPIFGAGMIDTHIELVAAWRARAAAVERGASAELIAGIDALLFAMPEHVFSDGRRVTLTPETYAEVAADWSDRERAADLAIEYTRFFAEKYREAVRIAGE